MAKMTVTFVKIGDLEFSRPEPSGMNSVVENCEATLRRGNLQAALVVRDLQTLLRVFAEAAKGVHCEVGNLDLYGFSLSFKPDASGHTTIAVEMRNSAERWTVSAKTIVDLDEVKQASRQFERFLRVG
jgi:hypothetical protein